MSELQHHSTRVGSTTAVVISASGLSDFILSQHANARIAHHGVHTGLLIGTYRGSAASSLSRSSCTITPRSPIPEAQDSTIPSLIPIVSLAQNSLGQVEILLVGFLIHIQPA